MRCPIASAVIIVLGLSALRAEVAVELTPFEPGYSTCFDWTDKFAHPKEIVAPSYVYPEEMRKAGIVGEVVVLVTLKPDGYPERLSVLYDTHERTADHPGAYFSTAVIDGLKKAHWLPARKRSVWFYTKVKFILVDKGDPRPTGPGTVVGLNESK